MYNVFFFCKIIKKEQKCLLINNKKKTLKMYDT